MEDDIFRQRLIEWCKTPEGIAWKETMSLKLEKCKSKMRQDNILRYALMELKTDWERQDFYKELGLNFGDSPN
jgi:hypothetical protein